MSRHPKKARRPGRYTPPTRSAPQDYLAPARRGGPADVAARVPALRPLADAAVAVLGLGGLGAPTSLELARAGVGELRLVDHDTVDPATTVRWPFGLPAAGHPKTAMIEGFIAEHYPYTTVRTWEHRIGAVRFPDEHTQSDLQVLDEVLKGADLVVDMTAESGVWDVVADLAQERGVTYLAGWATPGVWGGVVARVRPDADGCWLCVRYGIDDGRIPAPPEDPVGNLQPAGCADPTFTGTSFDLAAVSGIVVRLAVSTLCTNHPGAYPPSPWDVVVLAIRDADTAMGPSVIYADELRRHLNCPRCSNT